MASGLTGQSVMAQVKGECANCHTMHNSQNGGAQVFVGATAGWNASNPADPKFEGPSAQRTNQETLLKSDCVGCHSSNTNNVNIVTVNGNDIPIVFSTGAYPGRPLAGGNFYNVSQGQDGYGHNVRGVAQHADPILGAPAHAPGGGPGFAGCANSCHSDLTLTDAATQQGDPGFKFNGCKGCHIQVGHHNANDATYRFLGGHGVGANYVDAGPSNAYESPDWEATITSQHNIYKRYSGNPAETEQSIGRFCVGCHGQFHAAGDHPDPITGVDNGGDDNSDNKISRNSIGNTPGATPWLRHPTDVNIPTDPQGEYAAMFQGAGKGYSMDVPVAQDPAGDVDHIDSGDQVMCLSCHRAHGSNQPDGLRWDYNGMLAHNALPGVVGTGCFYCHTTKDS